MKPFGSDLWPLHSSESSLYIEETEIQSGIDSSASDCLLLV